MVDYVGVAPDGPGLCEVDGCEEVGDHDGRCEEHEVRPCAFVVFSGSRNPESPNFGPDEMCEEDAEPGEDYCEAHLPWVKGDD